MPARKAAAKPEEEAAEVKPAAAKRGRPAKKKPAVKKATVVKKAVAEKPAPKPEPKPAPDPVPEIVEEPVEEPVEEAATEIFIPPVIVEVFVAGKKPLVLANKMVYPGERHIASWRHLAQIVKARPGQLKWRVGPGNEWKTEIPE